MKLKGTWESQNLLYYFVCSLTDLIFPHSLNIPFYYFSCYFPFHSCLRAIRQLQKNGHIPSDASLFKSYAEYGHFVDVRVAALEALVDYTRGRRRMMVSECC